MMRHCHSRRRAPVLSTATTTTSTIAQESRTHSSQCMGLLSCTIRAARGCTHTRKTPSTPPHDANVAHADISGREST